MSELYFAQYRDINVGPNSYRDLDSDGLLLVTKIFYTIQGEGPYAGWPAIFIRLAGCNRGDKTLYGCQFCDTNFLFAEGKRMSVEDIMHALPEAAPQGSFGPIRPVIVITGGEPMMQDRVTTLTHMLIASGWRVQIESNGDRIASGFLDNALCKQATLVVSPKIVTKRGLYANLPAETMHRADVLKYLVDHRIDSPYYALPGIVSDKLLRPKVYVSPITVYKREVMKGEIASVWDTSLINQHLTRMNYKHAAALCLAGGYKLSVQKHLFLELE